MSTYLNILVGIDVYETEGHKHFRQACARAKEHEATLHIATVLNIKEAAPWERLDPKLKELQRQAYEILEDYHQEAKERGVSHVKLIFDTGSPKARITRHLAPEHDIDLIVLGATHGNQIENLLLGSTAEGVLRQANCDVLTVRETSISDKDHEKQSNVRQGVVTE